jgi:CobQ-like glutamine amidotransferase family enzyme
MNLYGDIGNIIALKKRIEWRNIECKIEEITLGQKPDFTKADILFLGGGQDRGQKIIEKELLSHKEEIKTLIEKGLPCLLICGGYQLFGKYFKTTDGSTINGIEAFDAWTIAGGKRMIGNIIIESPVFGRIVGFENHSGKTYLGNNISPLGKIIKGYGNNGTDGTEGILFKNVIGTYLHGPFLPKNFQITDWFIKQAIKYRYGQGINLLSLDNTFEKMAFHEAEKRAIYAKSLSI